MSTKLDTTQLSENFYRYEFACNCGCGFNSIDTETLAVIQDVRNHFGVVVIVTSASRCVEYNRRIGGARHSQHLVSRAVDFRIPGVSPKKAADYLASIYDGKYGLGRYPNFTHIDTRSGTPARWGQN